MGSKARYQYQQQGDNRIFIVTPPSCDHRAGNALLHTVNRFGSTNICRRHTHESIENSLLNNLIVDNLPLPVYISQINEHFAAASIDGERV